MGIDFLRNCNLYCLLLQNTPEKAKQRGRVLLCKKRDNNIIVQGLRLPAPFYVGIFKNN
jgi:hypothetical protein